MITRVNILNIAVPITEAARHQAERFALEQQTPVKAEQVYRNTLAVLAVSTYLKWMAVTTELETSLSWDAQKRRCFDVADLQLKELGCLECRPVKPGDQICVFPEEVRQERIGYVVVEIAQDCNEAILLGFAPEVITSELPLERLQPLTILIEHLCPPASDLETTLELVNLQQWLISVFASRWQTVEQLLNPIPTPAFTFLNAEASTTSEVDDPTVLIDLIRTTEDEELRWKAAERLWSINPGNPAAGVRRFLDLGMQLAGCAVTLMVAILQKPDQSLAVLLRAYPMGSQRYLPPGLQLSGLYKDGKPFLEAQARERDDYIQLKFSAELGEQFSVCIGLGDAKIVESFIA